MSADATCSTMESYSNSSARVPESSGNSEDRLQRRRERERARRASDTAEQREERLRVRRARDRARRAAQTAEERDARLRQIRDNRRQSLATESEEERAVRLQQMRDRLASETERAEQEAIRQSVQERQSNLPSTVAWPPACETPINEFRTEGYISCAFPTLFRTGAADFVAPRACAVTIGNYLKHLLMYEDRRFARHPRFCYFALNTAMRWRALQTGRIYVR